MLITNTHNLECMKQALRNASLLKIRSIEISFTETPHSQWWVLLY